MKLKKYLRDVCNITYSEYKSLPDYDRWRIEWEFNDYNRRMQLAEQTRNNFLASGGIIRQATSEEMERFRERSAVESKHYENSLNSGGINGDVFIALHHRNENYR